MEDDERIMHLLNRVAKAEIEMKLVEAVAQGYDDLRQAASREISRRISERPPHD